MVSMSTFGWGCVPRVVGEPGVLGGGKATTEVSASLKKDLEGGYILGLRKASFIDACEPPKEVVKGEPRKSGRRGISFLGVS